VLVERYNLETSMMNNNKIAPAQMKSFFDNNFIVQSLQLIDFSIAMDDRKSAKEIQQKAIEVVNDYRLRDALSDRK